MLGVRLVCQSETAKYVGAEVVYFDSLLELHEYKNSFVSVFDKHYCYLNEISVPFSLDKI